MKKILLLGGIAVLSLGLLSGCAKKAPVTEEAKEGEVIKIRWMVDPAPNRQQEIAGFESSTLSKGVKVELDMGGAGSPAILTQIAGGNPPDLFSIYDPATLLVYMEKDALLDISPYMKKYGVDPKDFWAALYPYMEYKGKFYGLPPNCGPFVLFYNKKMFDDAGVAYPNEKWTWKELLDAAQKLTKKDPKTGRYTQFGLLNEDPDMFIWQNGGWRYSKDKKKCIIDSKEAKEGFGWYYDLRFKHHVMPTPSEANGLAATGGWGGTLNLFAAKKVAMFIQGRWMAMVFRKDKSLDWNIAPVPRGKYKVTKLASKIFAIPKNCKHPDATFRFLSYLVGPDQYIIAKSGDGIPSRRSIGNSKDFLSDPAFPNEDRNKIYLDEMNFARAPEYSPFVSEIEANKIFWEEIDLCYNQKESPDQAMDNIAKRINELMKGK